MDTDYNDGQWWARQETEPIPKRIKSMLLSALVSETAHFLLGHWKPGDVVHLGDPFGPILSWLWTVDPDQAVMLFAQVLTQIRHGNPASTTAVTLDAMLVGLPLSLQNLSAEQVGGLVARLRREVPAVYGRDPNTTT